MGNHKALATSSDGAKIVAGVWGGFIHTSSPTTAEQVISSVNAWPSAAALVTAEASGVVTGSVAAVAATNLAGGTGTPAPSAIQTGGLPSAPTAPGDAAGSGDISTPTAPPAIQTGGLPSAPDAPVNAAGSGTVTAPDAPSPVQP
ncbi:MAG: hypothetical protein Q8Q59_08365 [Luteolibacter sp.]|nr:hypothetical protein [Luteolibacter sp.]